MNQYLQGIKIQEALLLMLEVIVNNKIVKINNNNMLLEGLGIDLLLINQIEIILIIKNIINNQLITNK